ncbi:MAG: hypothetical protein RR047_01680 [Bacilli bacterium]
MNEMQCKYDDLPIIGISDSSFFSLDESKEESKIKSLINKYIIFELWDMENHGIQVIPGKLLEYNNDYLLIRQYDDGTEETRKVWTDGQGNDLFKNFEEKINIKNIRGIEEYKGQDEKEFIKYKGCICEIRENINRKIIVLFIDYNGCEVSFYYKHVVDGKVFIDAGSIPAQLIESIKIIKD